MGNLGTTRILLRVGQRQAGKGQAGKGQAGKRQARGMRRRAGVQACRRAGARALQAEAAGEPAAGAASSGGRAPRPHPPAPQDWEQEQEAKEMGQLGPDALFLMSTPVDATPLEKKKKKMARRPCRFELQLP